MNNPPPDEPPPSYEEAVGSSDPHFLRPTPLPSSPQPASRPRPRAHSARPESSASAERPSPYPAYQNAHSRVTSSPSPSATQPQAIPSPQPGQLPKLPSIPRQFPPTFNVYRVPFSDGMILGEHASEPMYALDARGDARTGRPQLILHSGPTPGHPPLAILEEPPFYGQTREHLLVRLPPSPFPGASAAVALEATVDFPRVKFGFSIEAASDSSPVAQGSRLPLERFEWRMSRGDAVSSLGGSGYGWKLVRLVDGPPAGCPRQEWAKRVVSKGSDGFEVVAAVSESSSLVSLNRVLRFGFFGTGNSGLLGERWAVMAVMTALGLYVRHHRPLRRRVWT